MRTLLLFFDGIGIGRDDPEANPFAAVGARRLSLLAGRAPDPSCSSRALDATLGVPGLPQSATGQTTLLTGVNAARLVGRHVSGVPGPSLRGVLERESLFVRLVRGGRKPTFANAYTRGHLEARRPRWSATTRMVRASGVPFRMLHEEGRRGEALFHDWAGDTKAGRALGAPAHEPGRAAKILSRLVEEHDLVLYEYFLTDVAGHRGSPADRLAQARRAEELVDAVVGSLELSSCRLVVVSDHGNLEESHHDLHTLNPVPLLAWGASAEELVRRVEGLEDLTPALAG
ncbi:MAG: peptidase [Acidobacteriia bacterium]|nr:peptidase [Terriglobia bacterium]